MSDITPSDRLLLAIVSGLEGEVAARKIGIPDDQIRKAINQVRRRLTLAADYNRDEQLGTAIKRLNECYSRAYGENDVKTCVNVQKELNRLMDLYRTAAAPAETSVKVDGELRAVREILAPLFLKRLDDGVKTQELARLAVCEIMSQRPSFPPEPPEHEN